MSKRGDEKAKEEAVVNGAAAQDLPNGTSVVFSRQFGFAGTIKKTTTFATKGGGLTITLETGDKHKATEIIEAEGMACNIIIQVSSTKIDRGQIKPRANEPELDLTGIDGLGGTPAAAPEGSDAGTPA